MWRAASTHGPNCLTEQQHKQSSTSLDSAGDGYVRCWAATAVLMVLPSYHQLRNRHDERQLEPVAGASHQPATNSTPYIMDGQSHGKTEIKGRPINTRALASWLTAVSLEEVVYSRS